MREDHRIHQPDALRDFGSHRIRKSAEHAGPEKEQAGGGERHFKSLEQPDRKQRLNHEAAGECIEAEKGGQFVDDATRHI